MTAPISELASTDSVSGLLTSYNFRVGAWGTSYLRCPKLFCVSSQCHSVPPSSSFLKGALMSDRFGMSFARYWIISLNLNSSHLFLIWSQSTGTECVPDVFNLFCLLSVFCHAFLMLLSNCANKHVISSSLCSTACTFFLCWCCWLCDLHILAKWFFLLHALHVWPIAGHFLVPCLKPHLLQLDSFCSVLAFNLPFCLSVRTLLISTSSVGALTWLVVISLARHISMAFSGVRSASLNSLPLTWSSVIPQTILSRTSESCNCPNSQSLALFF